MSEQPDRDVKRGQDEIVKRISEIDSDDILGFRHETLIDALDFEHAKPWLIADATEQDWDAARPESFTQATTRYLAFAIRKVIDHRGISAERSVVKLRAYAWLLGRDDAVAAMDAAAYPQYGAPKLKAFALAMGLPWPTDDIMLEHMASGQPCSPNCWEGCGR